MLQNIVIADNNEMIEYFIDIAYDPLTKNEIRMDNMLSFISNPKNAKSRKLHERYQNQYLMYCNKEEEYKLETKVTLCNYFSILSITGHHTAGNF